MFHMTYEQRRVATTHAKTLSSADRTEVVTGLQKIVRDCKAAKGEKSGVLDDLFREMFWDSL